MEDILQKTAVKLVSTHSKFENFIRTHISISDARVIYSILTFIMLISIFTFFSGGNFSIRERISYSAIMIIIGFTALIVISIKFRCIKLINESNSTLNDYKENSLNLDSYISKESIEDFYLYINGKEPLNKINFIGKNKNGKAANYHYLITIVEYFRKENFSHMSAKKVFDSIDPNFTLNNCDIKSNTFESRLSTWKSKKRDGKLVEREYIIKEILG